jgi:hypothetical protein
MTWTELLNEAIEDNYKVTDALMAMVGDADLHWKPATGSNWMTTGQLLMHITTACGFCCKGFVTGEWGLPEGIELPPEYESTLPPAEVLPTIGDVAEARERLAQDKLLALEMVARAGEADLGGRLMAAPWSPDCEMPLGKHLLGMVLHLQSHKSQLFYYLKLMGRDVNTFHLWGM